MASIHFNNSYSMIDPPLVYSPVASYNSTSITVTSNLYSGGKATEFFNGNFSYTSTAVYGTVKNYSFYDGSGSLLIYATGNLDAYTIYQNFGNPLAILSLVGAGNDTITASAGNQVVSGFQGNDYIDLGSD